MVEGLVAGKVYGRSFVTAKVRAATASGEIFFGNALAFDPTVQVALPALCEGDAVSLADTLTPHVYNISAERALHYVRRPGS